MNKRKDPHRVYEDVVNDILFRPQNDILFEPIIF